MVSSTVRFYHIPRVNEDPKISILSDMRRYIIHISQNVPEKVNGVIIWLPWMMHIFMKNGRDSLVPWFNGKIYMVNPIVELHNLPL